MCVCANVKDCRRARLRCHDSLIKCQARCTSIGMAWPCQAPITELSGTNESRPLSVPHPLSFTFSLSPLLSRSRISPTVLRTPHQRCSPRPTARASPGEGQRELHNRYASHRRPTQPVAPRRFVGKKTKNKKNAQYKINIQYSSKPLTV